MAWAAVVAVVAVLVTSSCSASVLSDALEVVAHPDNSSTGRVYRAVRQCLLEQGLGRQQGRQGGQAGAAGASDGQRPNWLRHGGHAGAAALPSLPATFWTPPYHEPPPSSVELCALRGFKCERHLVATDDGYTLALVHVVGRIGAPRVVGNPPVLVQHGMLMSSDAFLLRKDGGNLPLVLSDAGYDVWVGNYRNNAASPHVHVNMTPDMQQFWNYSWHEMGLHDLPAMVDYVLARSDGEDLFYVGHSMGSTGMAVLLSTRPEYNRKIRLASFLAPVAYVSRIRSGFFRQLAFIAPFIKDFLVRHQVWNVLPRLPGLHRLIDMLCLMPGMGRAVCEPLLFEVAGPSPLHTLPDYVALLAAYLPAGTTIRIMEHYYEVARTGKFRPLGYGMGDPNPGPAYNISAISAPVALFYADNDYFIHPPDVERLADDLPNVFHMYRVPDPTFNHFDFLLARDGHRLLYGELLATMRRRQGRQGDMPASDDSSPESNHVLRPYRSGNSPLVRYLLSNQRSRRP